MRYIEHIVEPDRLLLSWQPPDGAERMRLFVAELLKNGDDADLVYLTESDDYALARERGYREYPGLSAAKERHNNVQSGFLKRLPPRTRRDFGVYLNAIRIRPETAISDFALLGYSGAKLPWDDFTIIHPFTSAQPPFELLVKVQGCRYLGDALQYEHLSVGMAAAFEEEPDNEKDPDAVRIMIDGRKIGYVPRGLATQVRQWMRNSFRMDATLERINGSKEAPSLFLFLAVKGPAG